MTLKSNIRQAERNIAQRRDRISTALDGVIHSVRKRMVSPGALVAAGLVGAALERHHRLHGLRVQGLLETANAGLQFLLTLSSRAGTPTATHGGRHRAP